MPGKQIDEVRVLQSTFELRDVAPDGVVEGRAAPYNTWEPVSGSGGGYLERITPDTFKDSVASHGLEIKMLLHHEHRTNPIGKPLEWEHRSDGLHGVWKMDLESERGAEAWRLARDGYLSGLSVGFQPNPTTDTRDNDGQLVRVTRGAGARLFEVSLVSAPAYAEATLLLTRTAGPGPFKDPRIEQLRRDLGLVKS